MKTRFVEPLGLRETGSLYTGEPPGECEESGPSGEGGWGGRVCEGRLVLKGLC